MGLYLKVMSILIGVTFVTVSAFAQITTAISPMKEAVTMTNPMPMGLVMPTPVKSAFNVPQNNVFNLKQDPDECVHLDESDFAKLAKVFEIRSCYENRASYKNPDNKMSEVELLKSDNAICNCLKEKAKVNDILNSDILNKVMLAGKDQLQVLWTSGENVQNAALTPSQISIQNLESLLKKQKELPFHASIIFNGDEELTKAYSNNFANEQLPGLMEKMVKNQLVNPQTPFSDLEKKKIEHNNTLKNKKIDIVKELAATSKFQPSKPEEILKDPEVLPPGHCVTPREYLAFKQLPGNPNIFRSLSGKTSEFDEKDWDFNSLKSQYYELIDKPEHEKSSLEGREKLSILREKISFLNKNPMIRELFSSRTDFSYYKKFLDAQKKSIADQKDLTAEQKIAAEQKILVEQDKLKDLVTNHLPSKKKELFQIIKKMNVASSCEDTASVCLKKAFDGNMLDAYKNGLKDFFVSSYPPIGELVILNSQAEAFEELDNFTSGKLKKYRNKSNLTQKDVSDDFLKRTGLDVDSCSKNDSDIAVCSQIYSLYCRKMEAVMVNLESQSSDPALWDTLDKDLMYDFEPTSNPDFETFNNNLCSTPKKKNPKSDTEPSMTFFQFKENNCKVKNFKECREKFISEYRASIPADFVTFSNIVTKDPVKSVEKVAKIFKPAATGKSVSRDWVKMRKSTAIISDNFGKGNVFTSTNLAKRSNTNFAQNMNNFINPFNSVSEKSSEFLQPPGTNYNYGQGSTTSLNNAPPKIENLNDDQKRRLLKDWKEEEAKINDPRNGTFSQDAELKKRIEALEQLLAGQKKITDEQTELLNKALARQSPSPVPKVAPVKNEKIDNVGFNNNNTFSNSNIIGSSSSMVGKDPNHQNSSKTPGQGPSSSSASTSGSTSSRAPASINSQELAREMAKLASYRNEGGTISVETISASGNNKDLRPNAISLTVSDDQYQLLASDSAWLNLGDLKNQIPKDLIKELGTNKEIIVIISNRENPPFEVRLEMKNNKLVYKKNEKGIAVLPIKRTYTVKSLKHELTQGQK